MSSKKITMDYKEYLADIEAKNEEFYDKGFNGAKIDTLSILKELIENETELDNELAYYTKKEDLPEQDKLLLDILLKIKSLKEIEIPKIPMPQILIGKTVTVYNRYLFAVPVKGIITDISSKDGAFKIDFFDNNPGGTNVTKLSGKYFFRQECEFAND